MILDAWLSSLGVARATASDRYAASRAFIDGCDDETRCNISARIVDGISPKGVRQSQVQLGRLSAKAGSL